MPTPREMKTVTIPAATGESPVYYIDSSQAQLIENFATFVEGGKNSSIRSLNGPCPLEPDRGSGYGGLGTPFAVYHGMFNDGETDVTACRFGDSLYRHAGWDRGYTQLLSGLNSDERPRWPDVFVRVGNYLVWTNGIDRPRIIDFDGDGTVYYLGFNRRPSRPTVRGPSTTGNSIANMYPNDAGYSWPGDIGSVGDLMDAGNGWVLASEHVYYTQLQDILGNLSPLSAPSNPFRISQIYAQPWYVGTVADQVNCAEVDDLLRQAHVEASTTTEDHIDAIRLYRTPDLKRSATSLEPQLVDIVGGKANLSYPDRLSDSVLGPPAIDYAPVPTFKVACAHNGCLVIGNLGDAEGQIAISEPGFFGTFRRENFFRPDSGGAAITGLASHGGRLLAFTENSIYDCSQQIPMPISQGIGCVAPKSIACRPDGLLIWMARTGFYGLPLQGGQLPLQGGQPIPLSANYDRFFRERLNKTRMVMAAATFDYDSMSYLCAVTEAGQVKNNLILVFDGETWKRERYGLFIADLCLTQDPRRYVLMAATDTTPGVTASMIMVRNKENITYTPPDRNATYTSPWFRADAMAMTPVYIRYLYIGFVDTCDATGSITLYKNSTSEALDSSQTFKLYGAMREDNDEIEADFAGSATVGTSKFHKGRLTWRRVPADITDAYTWCFKISVPYPARAHIVGFAFDYSIVTSGDEKARIPGGSD